jgi:hypothetical protein
MDACAWDGAATTRQNTKYGSNYRMRASVEGSRLLSGFARPSETMKRAPRFLVTPRVTRTPFLSAPTTSGRIGQKLAPFRVLRPPQKQGTNQKTRKRPRTERGGGRALWLCQTTSASAIKPRGWRGRRGRGRSRPASAHEPRSTSTRLMGPRAADEAREAIRKDPRRPVRVRSGLT